MELVILLMAAFLLIHQLELLRIKKRLIEVEGTTAAVGVLVEDVNDLRDDFYGPAK